jgi:predicted Zn-dependent protease
MQTAALASNPNNRQLLAPVIQSLMILGRTDDVDRTISNAITATPGDAVFLRDMINFYAQQGKIPRALEVALLLEKAQPDQWDVPYTIAKYRFLAGQRDASYESLRRSVQLGGNAALQQIAREQLFQQVAADPEFQQAIRQGQSPEGLDIQQSVSNTLRSLERKSNPPSQFRK